MIHFTSLQAQQAFMQAIAEPEYGADLLNLVIRLVSGDPPQAIRLHTGKINDLGVYFDFDVHTLPVSIYTDHTGAERPDLTAVPLPVFTPETRQICGGLVKRANGWSAHT